MRILNQRSLIRAQIRAIQSRQNNAKEENSNMSTLNTRSLIRQKIRAIARPQNAGTIANGVLDSDMFDFDQGLSSLGNVEEVKEKEYIVPFSMRCLFDDKAEGGVRFVREGLIMSDTMGKKHDMVAEFTPIISSDERSALRLKANKEGILVIRVADVPHCLTYEAIPGKSGGEYRVKFVRNPKFVSFTPQV